MLNSIKLKERTINGKIERQSCVVLNYKIRSLWDDDFCSTLHYGACQMHRCPAEGCPKMSFCVETTRAVATSPLPPVTPVMYEKYLLK